MLYLRTASGRFIDAASIVELTRRGDQAKVCVAICRDGQEVALARYYSTPGQVERELPHLLREAVLRHCPFRAAIIPGAADCSATVCCAGM